MAMIVVILSVGFVYADEPKQQGVPGGESKISQADQDTDQRPTTRALIQSVSDVAKHAITTHESWFKTFTWSVTAVLVLLGIFGISEVKEFRSFRKTLKKGIESEFEEIKQKYEDALGEIEAMRDELKRSEEESTEDLKALTDIVAGFTYTTIYLLHTEKQDVENLLLAAKSAIERSLKGKFKDHRMLGWAHSVEGVVLRLRNDNEEALDSLKKAIEYEHDNVSVLFNAACCASLLNRRSESIGFLTQALSKDKNYAKLLDDPDLDNARKHPDFPKSS